MRVSAEPTQLEAEPVQITVEDDGPGVHDDLKAVVRFQVWLPPR